MGNRLSAFLWNTLQHHAKIILLKLDHTFFPKQDFVSELPQGIETIIGERGVTLSGGQRQRIAIARALLRKPSVLVLDDATSAVDPKVEAEILQNMKKETNCSLLVIAHRLATIRLAERVIFIDNGRVFASGSHDELLKIDDYANLVSAYEDVTT